MDRKVQSSENNNSSDSSAYISYSYGDLYSENVAQDTIPPAESLHDSQNHSNDIPPHILGHNKIPPAESLHDSQNHSNDIPPNILEHTLSENSFREPDGAPNTNRSPSVTETSQITKQVNLEKNCMSFFSNPFSNTDITKIWRS